MSKMKIIFGWKLTETYLCGKFVELEIIRKRPVKRRSFSIILIKSDSRRIIMDICIFIMAVFAVGSYIYKQFFIEATFSVSEILIISVSGAVVLQKIHDVVIKLIYTVNHHTT